MVRVGVALDGTGWHPSSWQAAGVADAVEVFGAAWWRGLGERLDGAGVDFVTLEDGIGLQSSRFGERDRRGDQVRGRLDPVVAASVLAVGTQRLEIVVSRNVSHVSPFHVASQIASLNALAPGRVVLRPQVSADADDAGIVGGESTPRLQPEDIYLPKRIGQRLQPVFAQAADFVKVVRHLWASWPGDSLAADQVPDGGREFVAWDRIVAEPFRAGRYSTTGPLNVPVLGVPGVASLAHHALEPYRFAAAVADRVFVTPEAPESLDEVVSVFRAVESLVPDVERTSIHADLVVFLGESEAHAKERKDRLDEALGGVWTPDARVFTGTADELVAFVDSWTSHSEVDGVRLRPAVIPFDLDAITTDFLPRFRDLVRSR